MSDPDSNAGGEHSETPLVETGGFLSPSLGLGSAPLFASTPKAAQRFVEFFTEQINNEHTRRAYLNAARRFARWCEAHGLHHLGDVQAFHVAAFVRELQGEVRPPTVKQHLAAMRMLFDWLVTGHVIGMNPAHAVRGPKFVVKNGKTPVLTREEARTLLDSIGATTPIGLRDRALIGVMVYPFARVNAVISLKVRDYFIQGRRGWVRLHEKGGQEHEVPCHHILERLLDEYLEAAGIADDADGPLFRTTGRKTGTPCAMWQQDVYRMIRRRATAAGITTKIGNHTFRATGITAYLKNGGLLEHAQTIANHASPRTTKLYERRADEITPDEIEKISI